MIETERLLLRQWQESDFQFFAEINSDPKVTEFLGIHLTKEESNGRAQRIQDNIVQYGYGLWATEVKDRNSFIGFIGLSKPNFVAHFTPAVEIGWRLSSDHWNKGYATEGARAVLQFAFNVLNLSEIVSFTTETNTSSRRVMEKIGMVRNPDDDFNHPNLDETHPLRRHVLYRIQNS